ncbi:MAG: FAD-dependent oxidoreductase [Deltaproteobacteria bacterium]|nr:FAD-dependent oxidoreductase [Deltaproteobacteria bacterium]
MKKSNTIITNHSKSEDQMDQRMPKGSKGIEESKSFGDGTQEGSITRRQFVVGAGTALAGGAIGIVGGSLLPSGDVAIAGTTKKWNKETDVIVVGGGAAGIFGALSASEAGDQVLLLEKEPIPYLSSSAICGGSVAAARTSVQKEAGIEDRPGLFYKDIMEEGEYTNDKNLVKVFTENSWKTIEWFRKKGLKFVLRAYPGFSLDRLHYAGTGRQFVDILLKEIKAKNVPIYYETPAKRIVIEYSTGRVLGIEAEKAGKKILIKARKAVLITTGGFGGNKDMIDRFLIPFKGAIVGSSPGATGTGLLMGMKATGSVTHLSYGAVYAYGFVTKPDTRRGLMHRGYDLASVFGGILINKNGKRFVKEETSPTSVAWALTSQPEHTVYVISDRVMWEEFMARPVFPVIGWTKEQVLEEAEKEKYFINKADTLEELARKAGLNQKDLKKTISNYNSYVAKGHDPEFGRDKKHLRKKIVAPPFYSLKGLPIVMVTCGGLKVNERLQVLDPYLVPIPKNAASEKSEA